MTITGPADDLLQTPVLLLDRGSGDRATSHNLCKSDIIHAVIRHLDQKAMWGRYVHCANVKLPNSFMGEHVICLPEERFRSDPIRSEQNAEQLCMAQ